MYIYLLLIHIIIPIQNFISYGDITIPPESSSYQHQIITIKLYLTNTNITVWAKLHSFGFFGILYQNHMSQGDYNIIQIDNSTKTINIGDFHSFEGHSKPVPDDKNNLYVLGYESNQKDYVIVKYTRFLQTNDQQDRKLILGDNFNFSFTKKQGKLTLSKHNKKQYAFFGGILKNSQYSTIVNSTQQQMYTHDQQNALKHGILLTIFWTVLSDLGILVKHLYFFKYRIFAHICLFSVIIMTTVYQIYKMLSQQEHNEDIIPQSLKVHYNLALCILVWICFQGIIGITNWIFQRKDNLAPNIVVFIKNIHKYSGYILIIILKINLIIGWIVCGSKLAQIIILIWNITIIWLYTRYLKKKNVSSCIRSSSNFDHSKLIEDINFQYYQNGNYVIFDHKVYQLNKYFVHPGGKQIVKLIKGRQIDRFMYGMQRIQQFQKCSRFAHPIDSIQILGNPIYMLPKSTRYTLNCNNFRVIEQKKINNEISLLYLKSNGQNTLFEQKSTNVLHFGQFWKLQCFGITRLYTCIVSLRKQNIEKIYSIFDQLKITYIKNQKTDISEERLINKDYSIVNHQKDQVIPLLIKRYQHGMFTSKLFTEINSHNIIIEGLKGRGFGLQLIPKGQILIIAGGTGLFPFLDLLDTLFKLIVKQNEPNIQISNIQTYKELLGGYKFKVFISVKNIYELIIINQLKYMAESNNSLFQLFIRFTEKTDHLHQNLFSNHLIKQKFNLEFIQNFVDVLKLKKILVCGPARLYKQIQQVIKQTKISQSKIFYV